MLRSVTRWRWSWECPKNSIKPDTIRAAVRCGGKATNGRPGPTSALEPVGGVVEAVLVEGARAVRGVPRAEIPQLFFSAVQGTAQEQRVVEQQAQGRGREGPLQPPSSAVATRFLNATKLTTGKAQHTSHNEWLTRSNVTDFYDRIVAMATSKGLADLNRAAVPLEDGTFALPGQLSWRNPAAVWNVDETAISGKGSKEGVEIVVEHRSQLEGAVARSTARITALIGSNMLGEPFPPCFIVHGKALGPEMQTLELPPGELLLALGGGAGRGGGCGERRGRGGGGLGCALEAGAYPASQCDLLLSFLVGWS